MNDETPTSERSPTSRDRESLTQTSEGPNPLKRTLLTAGGSLLVAVIITIPFTLFIAGFADRQAAVLFVAVKTLVTTFSATLLAVLTRSYLRIYREIATEFTLSLVLVSVALLLYALTANPIVHLLFRVIGVQGGGLDPFTVVPDLFASGAAVVLVYQSYR